jgi:hypothetical protein
LENQLEVPLDSHVGKGLRSEREGANLPRWNTIKGLRPADSSAYQAVAGRVAARHGFARVHLDLEYWRRDRVT